MWWICPQRVAVTDSGQYWCNAWHVHGLLLSWDRSNPTACVQILQVGHIIYKCQRCERCCDIGQEKVTLNWEYGKPADTQVSRKTNRKLDMLSKVSAICLAELGDFRPSKHGYSAAADQNSRS